ncbi:MAG: regulatory protein RecX [Bacteroidales bacterium]|jgi:regulatory protein|nr:regulatory protein RecX [Bacteroidales bacterium]
MSEYKNILARAAKLCSTGEKCEHDIREKMIKWGAESEDVEKAIKYLLENKFIDDRRYATFFTKDRLKFNKWGRIKIGYSLRQKHISSEIIEEAIQALNEEQYIEILDQLISAKIRSAGDIKVAANKAKVIRFAAQRGFTSEEIFTSINRIEKRKEEY